MALTAIRMPTVRERQIAPIQAGSKGAAATALYTFNLHPEDGAALLEYAKQLMRAVSANGEEERRRVHGQLYRMTDDQAPREPAFRP